MAKLNKIIFICHWGIYRCVTPKKDYSERLPMYCRSLLLSSCQKASLKRRKNRDFKSNWKKLKYSKWLCDDIFLVVVSNKCPPTHWLVWQLKICPFYMQLFQPLVSTKIDRHLFQFAKKSSSHFFTFFTNNISAIFMFDNLTVLLLLFEKSLQQTWSRVVCHRLKKLFLLNFLLNRIKAEILEQNKKSFFHNSFFFKNTVLRMIIYFPDQWEQSGRAESMLTLYTKDPGSILTLGDKLIQKNWSFSQCDAWLLT
jgi:hypothetical protein